MMRLALLFLLVCLVWQGLPGARGEGPATVFEIAHTGWHAQVDAHHHHGDGSTHYDESDESLPHNHLDQGTGTALLAASCTCQPSQRPPAPHVSANAHAAHWSPDVPLRPPSALA